MSMRQLCVQLDPILKETFKNDSLNSAQWFAALEKLVREHMPRHYREIYEPHQVVLQYVRLKAMEDD